jgi:hypothetical protein
MKRILFGISGVWLLLPGIVCIPILVSMSAEASEHGPIFALGFLNSSGVALGLILLGKALFPKPESGPRSLLRILALSLWILLPVCLEALHLVKLQSITQSTVEETKQEGLEQEFAPYPARARVR